VEAGEIPWITTVKHKASSIIWRDFRKFPFFLASDLLGLSLNGYRLSQNGKPFEI
jgi:hypothetical protein